LGRTKKGEAMNFQVEVTVDHDTGSLLAAYFMIRNGKVHVTRELVDGKLLADYDKKGRLLGIEMLGPCSARVLDRIDVEDDVKTFVKAMVPRAFLLPLPKLLSTAAG
jgi:uncharacterized protein YuzE